jgi:hypothetical protein
LFSHVINTSITPLFQLLANQWNRGWGDVGSFDQNLLRVELLS